MRPAASTLKRWRENPVAFAVECCHFEPDAWQRDYLSVLPSQAPNEQRVSLQACTGPGKTAVMAIGLLNFISCYGTPTEHPKALCTSITEDNLRANLWPELSVWQQRSEFLKRSFKWTATRFSSLEFPETWFIEARSWPKRADPKQLGRTLSGLHAPFVKVAIDEVGDVPVPVVQSAEQIFSSSSRYAKLAIGGNPTSHTGGLYHAAVTPGWKVIRVTGDPDNPKRSPRINMENAKRQIALYGREDPWVMATILGEFPPGSISALLDLKDVQASQERNLEPSAYDWAQKRLGADVSRFGSDPTILFPRQGLLAGVHGVPFITMRHPRGSPASVTIANRIMDAKARWNWEQVFIDATGGWAAGARDILISAGYPVQSIQYHAPAPDPRYYNMRAYMWWHGAQWVKGGGQLPPNCPGLVKQLTEVTYSYKNGRLIIEDKEQVKARIGESPNEADALFQTFAMPDMPGEMEQKLLGRNKHQAKTDFDPYADSHTQHQARTDFDPYGDRGGM
jgi:phage terminase large subunit